MAKVSKTVRRAIPLSEKEAELLARWGQAGPTVNRREKMFSSQKARAVLRAQYDAVNAASEVEFSDVSCPTLLSLAGSMFYSAGTAIEGGRVQQRAVSSKKMISRMENAMTALFRDCLPK